MGMTFSREVKEELSKIIPKARHCRIAEYAAQDGYPCFLIADANHSLETGNAGRDIENLRMIMDETQRFIENIEDDDEYDAAVDAFDEILDDSFFEEGE